MAESESNRRHFILNDTARTTSFKGRSAGGGRGKVPALDRAEQASRLQTQLAALGRLARRVAADQRALTLESGIGLQVVFAGWSDVDLAFESLGNGKKGIELLSTMQQGNRTVANVYVPDGKLAHYEGYVQDYLTHRVNKHGDPLDHRSLIDAIESISPADIASLWTDDPALLPQDEDEPFWWEVWLVARSKGRRQAAVEDFSKLMAAVGCEVTNQRFDFPERSVVLMRGSRRAFSQAAMRLNCVAELRRAKETANFFDDMPVTEQRTWADELLRRSRFPQAGEDVPHVCLLDSGVNRGHPLLQGVLDGADMHTVNPGWGVDDTENHGTGMAGLSMYGDLTDALASDAMMNAAHRLESVKLLPATGTNVGEAQLHAHLFQEAVARPEISAPLRARVFASAVTASDYRDKGRPSSWSAAVDKLVVGDETGTGAASSRLFVLAAGNTSDPDAWRNYPESLSVSPIHDPGQAWNAITVGACTHKVNTDGHPSLKAVADEGGLSPYTTTSSDWDGAWPLKPDIVMEGGNVGMDAHGAVGMSSLHLLSANHQPLQRLFTAFNATSAASALCANDVAVLMAMYPGLRRETIRALLVHAARWTPAMETMYLVGGGSAARKKDYAHLIRHCGWGVPNMARALWSAANSLTLVMEGVLKPYRKGDGSILYGEMALHELPWPRDALETLGDLLVRMRVTLSYFIEPNPSARGSASRYHYPSHRLRFDVRRSSETNQNFLERINAAVQKEPEGVDAWKTVDPNWLLGAQQRHRGSLHQDIWEGTAAELANRDAIAVYPATGWWRTRPALRRHDSPAPYSLVVSIETSQTDIDLYALVEEMITIRV